MAAGGTKTPAGGTKTPAGGPLQTFKYRRRTKTSAITPMANSAIMPGSGIAVVPEEDEVVLLEVPIGDEGKV